VSSFWLWLRVRRLRQYLAVSALTGLGGCWIGTAVSPVPGQLFADVAGVPLVYLSPVVLAVSLAQWVPVGTYWFETATRPVASAAVVSVGIVIAVGPPLISSTATEVCLISARNGVLLAALVLGVRRYTMAAAACTAALVPCFIVWTFGWTESGRPKPWAFLLVAPMTPWVLALTAVLLIIGLAGLTRVRQATDPDP
jgi:hypothetical protein